MQKRSDYKKRSHGAVTVFIAIILVPCMVFTCVFTDVSRVQLAKATSESAADLALDSLLGRYDDTLKDYYGLVASCQNIEEYYDVTEQYFKGMLAAEGVDDVGSELFTAYLHQLRTGDYTDFLRVEFPGDVTVSSVENGNMGSNPALIEDGIVEFMKYRGPVEIAQNLYERFQDLDLEGNLKDAKENEPIVKEKREFAEAQSELLEAAFYSYVAIRKYVDSQGQGSRCPSEAFYTSLSSDMLKICRDYLKATELITLYYSGTDDAALKPVEMVFDLNERRSKKDVGKKIVVEDDEGNKEKYYCITDEKLESLKSAFHDGQDIQTVINSANTILAAMNAIPPLGSDTNEAVYCVKMKTAITQGTALSDMRSAASSLRSTYAKLVGASECDDMPEDAEESEPDGWRDEVDSMKSQIEAVFQDYLFPGGSSAFAQAIDAYELTATSVYAQVTGRSFLFSSEYCGREVTIEEFAYAASGRISTALETLKEREKQLQLSIDGGRMDYNGKQKTVKSLDKLKTLTKNYGTELQDWEEETDKHTTGEEENYADKDKVEIQEIKGGDGTDNALSNAIDEQSAVDLKTRLQNILSDVQDCIAAIEAFQYGGQKITAITNGTQLIHASRNKIPDTLADIRKSVGKSQAQGYYEQLITPSESGMYQAPDIRDGMTENNPDMGVNPPDLYNTLHTQFQSQMSEVDNEIESNKSQNKEYERKQKEESEKAQGVDNSVLDDKGGDIPDGHSENAVSLNPVSFALTLIEIVQNLFGGSGDEIRDQIYVCEYIMDMFSYASYNNEGKFHLAQKDNEDITVKDFAEYSQNYKEAWAEPDPTKFDQNKSLTNRLINSSNNKANLGEVEYILYGKSEIDENLKQSYKNIYAIREALNLVSGFQNFYSGSDATAEAIDTIAITVSSLSSGVIPVCATKCILILTLSILETAKDMDTLKKGAPVVLYKTKAEQWAYKISCENGDKSAGFNSEGADVSKGIYYSDYLYLFLLFGLMNDDTYGSMLLRTGDLIEANLKLSDEGFDLDKAQCYFQLKSDVRVKPLMLSLPIVDSVDKSGAENLRNQTDWRTFTIDILRGYS